MLAQGSHTGSLEGTRFNSCYHQSFRENLLFNLLGVSILKEFNQEKIKLGDKI